MNQSINQSIKQIKALISVQQNVANYNTDTTTIKPI